METSIEHFLKEIDKALEESYQQYWSQLKNSLLEHVARSISDEHINPIEIWMTKKRLESQLIG